MRARGFAVNRHALNTLRVRGASFERGDTIESGRLADMDLLVPSISAALSVVPGVCEVKPKVTPKYIHLSHHEFSGNKSKT